MNKSRPIREAQQATSFFRALFLCSTLVSVALLCARQVGYVVPQPLTWLSWGIIELKILFKLRELIEWVSLKKQRSLGGSQKFAMKPSPLIALLLVESAVFVAFFKSWRKGQPLQSGFSFRDGPEYQAFGYVLWLSILVEMPFMLFLVNIVPALTANRIAIEGGLAFMSTYAMIAFRADKHAITHTSHRIISDGLYLTMGMRIKGLVPFKAIHSIERIPHGAWRKLSLPWQASGLVVAKISPLDKPNVVLRVEPGAVELHKMNGSTLYPDIIGLYLDDSGQFVNEVHAGLSQSRSEMS